MDTTIYRFESSIGGSQKIANAGPYFKLPIWSSSARLHHHDWQSVQSVEHNRAMTHASHVPCSRSSWMSRSIQRMAYV
jgi:hypothetical protein